jgi:glycosyltransferase involved in cell wall biosynthesis
MGRFMAQKGFRYLIDAIEALLNEHNLPKHPVVITFGAGGFVREEKQALKGRGIEGNFYFMPFTSDVAGTIKGVDVVAIPSLWEACPLLPMEALVCGTPLIGSNCIGLREVLNETPAIVVNAKDGNMLAAAIEKEVRNPTKKDFTSFVEVAAKRFDVRKQSLELEALYEQITS